MPPGRRNTQKDSLAGAASDRVRAIIEAAEASAEEIRAEAETEAQRIRGRAQERASALRKEVRSDVQGLIGSIREGVERLQADLERLEKRLAEPDREESLPVPRDEPVGAPVEEDLELAEGDEDDPDVNSASASEPQDADVEGARLVALNMALDGASRDEVDRYLRDNYQLSDPSALLDGVYASIGG